MSEHNYPTGQQGWAGGQPQRDRPLPGEASVSGWSAYPPPGQGSHPTSVTGPGGPQVQTSRAFTARPRTRLTFLIGAFIGLVLGGGGVGLGWFATTAGLFASTAGQADADAACAALARTASLDLTKDLAGYIRWGSAVGMAQAAAEANPQYRALHDAISRPADIVADTFSTEGPEFADAVAKAREACGH
ncbi:hypothetical protein ACQPZQ_31845 [Pseudonocardia sp. CA-142604]|uniref:hypothetical protein n=1 Tax=Pseudonocardia sp. CA-142604 TaxID=3240024 RepID=UPI003D8A0B58